ncbi:SPRY domain-containing protein [Variovorax sp. 2RAF20]
MAAHRYWQAVGLESYSGDALEISEFQLLGGLTRVDASATLTANVAPTSGSLANLKDDDTSTGAAWLVTKGLILSWDFGVGGSADVTDIRIGASATHNNFLLNVRLQWSDTGTTWTDLAPAFVGIAWPGARTKTASETIGAWNRGPHFGDVVLSSGGAIATHQQFSLFGQRPAAPPKNSGVLQVEWEWLVTSITSALVYVGFTGYDEVVNAQNGVLGWTPRGWSWYRGATRINAGASVAYGSTYAVGDVLGGVIDFGAGTITFYKNGVSQGVAYSGITFADDIYPGAKSAGSGSVYQTRLRTKNFTYPIAGATAWEDRETAIVTNKVRGSVRRESPKRVTTLTTTYNPTLTRIDNLTLGRKDFLTGVLGQGIGRVKGTTKDKGTPNVPVSERVRLYREPDGLLIREVWSTPGTGAYSFDYVDELQAYTVISYDHDKNFRAVVADNLTLAGGGVELIA